MLRSSGVKVLAAAVVAAMGMAGCSSGGDGPPCRCSPCGSAALTAAPGECGTGGSAGSGGTGMPITVNGCDSATAIDKTNDASTTINFAGIEYTPRCVRVRTGSTVIFSGNFTSHPLMGGTVNGSATTPDPASPIPATSSGSELTLTVSTVGAVPYYCSIHASSGMMGAIFVE